jgi:hypothetical protein
MSPDATVLSLVIRDVHGRPLEIGDEIFLALKGPVLFRIVNIRPNLDPKLSPNLVYVDLAATALFACQREARNAEFIRTRTNEEAGPSPFFQAPLPKGEA